jgi:hypothetical protein
MSFLKTVFYTGPVFYNIHFYNTLILCTYSYFSLQIQELTGQKISGSRQLSFIFCLPPGCVQNLAPTDMKASNETYVIF